MNLLQGSILSREPFVMIGQVRQTVKAKNTEKLIGRKVFPEVEE